MEYQINVQIARSNCKKPLNNTVNCVTQKNSKLEKVSDEWAIYDKCKWLQVLSRINKDSR